MHHDLYECKACTTLFSQVTDADGLLKSYESAPLHATQESVAAAKTYRALIEETTKLPPFSILDVGCGDGAFLSQMLNAGSQIAHGVEPSRAAAAQCRDGRVSVVATTLNEVPGNTTYDAVCLFQTVEHIPDPKRLIELMVSRLNSDGSIYLVCHDRHSLVNRLLRKRSPIFDIEHLQLFTQAGIRQLLESSGLQIRVLKRFSNQYPLSYALRLTFPKMSIPNWCSRINIPVPAGNLFVCASR
jgi:SAM-dependent methyltransferase